MAGVYRPGTISGSNRYTNSEGDLMEWLKELLKTLGIADADIERIDAEIRKELPKHFVPKSQYNDVSEARKKAEEALAERDKQLESLKKSAGDNEELRKQIQALQDENQKAREKYEAEVKELRLTTAIKLALAGQVHDPDIVVGLLDKSKIEIDDSGAIKTGLEDQIKSLRESKAFLFVQEPENRGPQFRGTKPAEGSDSGSGQKNPWSKEYFNLTEQGRILRENPELAKQLMATAKK
jgi:chromosome segregation ATPase